jgi:O-antigen/teichoic acid export membrane protein
MIMLDKSQQVRNTLYYLLPVSSSLLTLISIPIFTRILTPADYGVLALAMIYASILNGIANFGMTTVFERNYFQYRDNSIGLSQLFYSSILFVVFNFLTLVFITYIFRVDISEFLTGSNSNGLLIITAFASHFFADTANNFYFTYFKNSEKAKTHTKFRLFSNIVAWTLSLFLVAVARVGVIGIVMGQLVTGLSLFLYFALYYHKTIPFALSRRILLEAIKIGYPLTPRVFIGFFSTQLDKYMISILNSVSNVGVYHIGKKISELTFTFMTALQNVFNPHVYKLMFDEHSKKHKLIGEYLTPFLYVSIFVAFSIAIFAEELLVLLTPESYHGASPIISILSIYYGTMFFGKITGTQLIYSKKTHITSLLALLGVIINMVFVIPLTMKYGAIGAAFGMMLAGILIGAGSLFIAQSYFKIDYEWKKIFPIMIVFIVCSISLVFLKLYGYPYIWTVYIKIVGLAIYLWLGIKYNIVSKENALLINIFKK